MGSWKKLLVRMLRDPNPCTYTYHDAARVLSRLGFELAPVGSGTSHRRWRRLDFEGKVVVVGLVDSGSGPLKRAYIGDMVKQLNEHGLVPADLQDDDSD